MLSTFKKSSTISKIFFHCLLWGLCLIAPPGFAIIFAPPADPDNFPQPLEVRTQLRFWEKIFSDYPSTVALIHDSENIDTIVDIIDFGELSKQSGMGKLKNLSDRVYTANQYLERYNLAISRFKELGDGALAYGAIEQRLLNVYYRRPALLKSLYRGETRLRIQTGLQDSLLKASLTAQKLLPYMEKIFSQENVPPIMTRIAFVESMFNVKARSKVGASGIWQFMPATARQYLVINHLVDERLAPFKSTRAAARLLRSNYEALGSWPLAITAYNHGTNGIKNAVRSVGSQDIGYLIAKFESPSFGFASKNFYSEFLAVSRTYEKIYRKLYGDKRQNEMKIATIRLLQELSINDLTHSTSLTEDIIKDFNDSLKNEAFGPFRDHKLPVGFELNMPRELVREVVAQLNARGKTRYAIK